MLITVLAWVITAGVATALPFAWVRAWRSPWVRPWAMAWALTAMFGVMEMWQAEYRLGLAVAWASAYSRAADRLQKCQQLGSTPSAQVCTTGDFYCLDGAARSVPDFVSTQFRDELGQVGDGFLRSPTICNRASNAAYCSNLLGLPVPSEPVCQAQLRSSFRASAAQPVAPRLVPAWPDSIRPPYKSHTEAGPTPTFSIR